MQVSVILAHPNPQSLNHAIFHATVETLKEAGHTVMAHDLYAEGFDPLMTTEEVVDDEMPPEIEAHWQEVSVADGFVIIHPNWFRQPPAILTGWIHRVIRAGRAFRFVAGNPEGLLKADRAVVFNTANNPQEKEIAIFGDPLELIWKRAVFGVCGIEKVDRRVFSPVVLSTPEQRAEWLEEVRETIRKNFPA